MLKHTQLFAVHQRLGGRMVDFGGWEMPVQYSSIMDEHHSVRSAAGLFDISHMGEVLVTGPAARPFLNGILTNDTAQLPEGRGQYTLMCNENGGVVDDLYAYRLGEEVYLLVINAARITADFAWMKRQYQQLRILGDTELVNMSEHFAAVAVQGPKVVEFIDQCFPGGSLAGTDVQRASQLKKNQLGKWHWKDHELWISRTGYTGEDGCEIVASPAIIEAVWLALEHSGQPHGLKPCGLGARDTLRLEAGFPLYGHELNENTTPLEAGLSKFVSFDKGDFVGRAALVRQRDSGVEKKCVAFKMSSRSAPPRPGYAIWSTEDPGNQIGEVVSGTQSPSLGTGIGMGYVRTRFAQPDARIDIEIRNQRCPATIARRPLYRKSR